jgi:hypothetical protein
VKVKNTEAAQKLEFGTTLKFSMVTYEYMMEIIEQQDISKLTSYQNP